VGLPRGGRGLLRCSRLLRRGGPGLGLRRGLVVKGNFLHQGLGRAGHAHRLQRNLHRRARRVRPSGLGRAVRLRPKHVAKHHFPNIFLRRGGLAAHRLKQLRHTGRARLRGAGLLVEEVQLLHAGKGVVQTAVIGIAGRRAILHRALVKAFPGKEIIIRHKKHRLFQYQSFLLARKLRPKAWRNYLLYYNKSALSASFSGKLCPHARAAHPFFPKKPCSFLRFGV